MTLFWRHDQYKNLDPNKIKIDEKSEKKIVIYYDGYVKVKNLN